MMEFRTNREVILSQKHEVIEFLRNMPEERHIAGLLFDRYRPNQCVCAQGAILMQQGFVLKNMTLNSGEVYNTILVHEESGREYDAGDSISSQNMPGIPVSALFLHDEVWKQELQKASVDLVAKTDEIKERYRREGITMYPSMRSHPEIMEITGDVSSKLGASLLRVANAPSRVLETKVWQVKIHSEAIISPINFHHQVSNMEIPLSVINDSLGLKFEEFATLIEKTWKEPAL